MMIYHPETEQLFEYAAGSLHPSISLCVSVHLEYCEECRKQVAKMHTVGGLIFEQLEPQAVNPALLDQIFLRIDAQEKSTAATVKAKLENNDVIPGSIKKILDYDMQQLHWRSHGPQVRSAELLSHEGVKASLIRIAAGANIPGHDHRGNEYTVILDGSFSDDTGVYRKGDFILRKPGDKHSPTATVDKDCLCLAALEAPLKFNNAFYEVVNRLMPL